MHDYRSLVRSARPRLGFMSMIVTLVALLSPLDSYKQGTSSPSCEPLTSSTLANTTRYKGSGDTADPANFTCGRP